MNDLPISIQKSINKYQPITMGELTLWPVTVEEYDLFLIATPALEVLHQSLPVALMRVPLLSALYEMDYTARVSGKQMTGLFSCALLALALSLRLGRELNMTERISKFQIVVERDNPAKLAKLNFMDADGTVKTIEPSAYKELRRVIAAQNGVKLESDTANPDIVQAKKDMNAGGAKLDFSVESLISFAAATSGVDENEIYNWPILKLNRRTDALQTMLAYVVCGIGEASGATWKTGNPFPHPIFKRIDDGTGFATPMNNTANGTNSAQTKNSVQTIEQQILSNK